MPWDSDFLPHIQELVASDDRFASHGISVEHYIVSTGIRHLIEGSSVSAHVQKIWANEFVDQPPGPGYDPATHEFEANDGVIAQVGYMIDNTSKTRAIFEINKGPDVEVNARMAEEERKVPIKNMIYIADGPSDVPVFSVVGVNGEGASASIRRRSPRTSKESSNSRTMRGSTALQRRTSCRVRKRGGGLRPKSDELEQGSATTEIATSPP